MQLHPIAEVLEGLDEVVASPPCGRGYRDLDPANVKIRPMAR